MQIIVAMMLIAVPTLPKPEIKSDKVQKSVEWPGEKVYAIRGA